jgi:hypothetical protein
LATSSFISPLGLIFVLAFLMVLPIVALVDILRNDFKGNNKIIWVLLVIIAPLLGTALYWLIGTSQKLEK